MPEIPEHTEPDKPEIPPTPLTGTIVRPLTREEGEEGWRILRDWENEPGGNDWE